MADQTRISVALTPEDHREVLKLARRCNTSASALGQLAVRHMLLRETGGTVPMLPASSPNSPYAELLQFLVGTDNRNVHGQRLCRQHAIEWILMLARQTASA